MESESSGMGMMLIAIASFFFVLLSAGVLWYGNKKGWFDDLFDNDEDETDPPKKATEEKESEKQESEKESGTISGRKVYIYAPESCTGGEMEYNGNTVNVVYLFLSSRLYEPDGKKDFITMNYTDEVAYNVWTLSYTGETDTYYIINSEGRFMAVGETSDLPNPERKRITLHNQKSSRCKWIIHDKQGKDEDMYAIQSASHPDHYIMRSNNNCWESHQLLLAKKPDDKQASKITDVQYLWNIKDENKVEVETLIKDLNNGEYFIKPI